MADRALYTTIKSSELEHYPFLPKKKKEKKEGKKKRVRGGVGGGGDNKLAFAQC